MRRECDTGHAALRQGHAVWRNAVLLARHQPSNLSEHPERRTIMKLSLWKRRLLAGLMTLSVVGGSLAIFTAGDAAAGGGPVCFELDGSDCFRTPPKPK